ncbi:hypothetical protein E4T39_02262 [Aureobasidium subglaciale]|nr:hypothetical protein E4T39_02262 [Aureobasidium subglaciale]
MILVMIIITMNICNKFGSTNNQTSTILKHHRPETGIDSRLSFFLSIRCFHQAVYIVSVRWKDLGVMLASRTNRPGRTTLSRLAVNCYSTQNHRSYRILMLHGFAQSSKQFEFKTKFLREQIGRGLSAAQPSANHNVRFHFANAPFALERSALPPFDLDGAKNQDATDELDAYTWWHLAGKSPPFIYEGLDVALASIANTIHAEGPFDGVVGFSQGAALAVMVASLLEPGRRREFEQARATGGMRYSAPFESYKIDGQPPLKFVIPISGFGNTDVPMYKAFYRPRIETPSLHILGKADMFIKLKMSKNLIDCFDGPQVLFHSGGHRVPQINHLERIDALSEFLRNMSEK